MGLLFSSQRKKRVAVVGGGPAGLAFLRVFKDFGLDWEVVLLEARDEIGGIWSVTAIFKPPTRHYCATDLVR